MKMVSLLLGAAALACYTLTVKGIYLPGVAPKEFAIGQRVSMCQDHSLLSASQPTLSQPFPRSPGGDEGEQVDVHTHTSWL
jgi:hypothetical protein